jgi:HD-GYP domain-containing protein (c-di-GMP phosphodiesterase class II)
MSIADDILLKNERLNSKEYEEIKKHPIKGARILSVLSMFKDVVPIVKCHHERLDGKGYPEGLKGDQIPFLAKIVSVSDAFDAMMSDRHYRTRLDLKSAIQQLMDGAGTQFDPDVVRYFVAMLENYTNIQEELAVTYE